MKEFAAGSCGAARQMLGVTLLVVAVASLWGCGGGSGERQPARAAKPASASARLTPIGTGRYGYARGLFNELCAGCHTLADAGAHGTRLDLDRIPDLTGDEVWDAIQNGRPGMPAWKGETSARERTALATYVMSVAKRDGESGLDEQARKRVGRERARWERLAALVERQLDREGRKGEQPSGRLVPPAGE